MMNIASIKRVASFAAAGVLVSVLSGCSLIATQLATDFSLDVEPEELTVVRGGTGQVTVSIDRPVPIDVVPMPVTVWLEDHPDDVQADDVSLPSGIDEDELVIEVDGTAEPRTVELTIRASNSVKTREATVLLTITSP